MNKGDLVARVADDAGITKVQADAAIGSVIEAVKGTLKKGQKLTLVGFGTWSVSKRKARVGRNPRTGATIKIAARKVPKFTPGSELKGAVK